MARMRRKSSFVRFSLSLLIAAQAIAAPAERVTIAGRTVYIWRPEGRTPATGFPMVVFSHGYFTCATQSTFLMEALARAGYFVLAPNHRDSLCSGGLLSSLLTGQESFFTNSGRWSDATYKDRAADIRAIMDALPVVGWFQGVPVDRQRIALAGHSLGGYTALGLAGAWPAWKDDRVKAVLVFTPYCLPFLNKGNLRNVNVPVMYQGGTQDFGVSPTIRRANGAYDATAAPKYYVEFDGAGHFAWSDFTAKYQKITAEYSVAFLDLYLKGTDRLGPLCAKPLPKLVSLLRVDLK